MNGAQNGARRRGDPSRRERRRRPRFRHGHATDPNATLAALRSLCRNGRVVLMGSMEVDLPITYREMLINNWELMGHFMYSGADFRALIALVRSGQVPLDAIELEHHPLEALETAIDAAEKAEGLTCVTVCTS
ncbi:hypothetical protein ACLKMY_04500 [Paraburkholderia mimosarum]|uniref:hypothetical protein n=1 Tax=Paraburkholderia mimosarum TaxID=312026 RepID=UPI0012B5DF2E|nr:hypothetical protein [Paraburkholderia mimosarum]